MNKSILIIGAGSGFSEGVAEKFGSEGYSVGLISRNAVKLQAMVDNLGKKGIISCFSSANAGNQQELEQAILNPALLDQNVKIIVNPAIVNVLTVSAAA